MKATDLILAVGATLRLTRFVTSDFLGEWTIVGPAKRWAWKRSGVGYQPSEIGARVEAVPTPPHWSGWRSKLVKGLDCPFCVGFWIGAVVLVATVVCPKPLRPLLRLAYGSLGLNYAVGHISSRIDG